MNPINAMVKELLQLAITIITSVLLARIDEAKNAANNNSAAAKAETQKLIDEAIDQIPNMPEFVKAMIKQFAAGESDAIETACEAAVAKALAAAGPDAPAA